MMQRGAGAEGEIRSLFDNNELYNALEKGALSQTKAI